MNITKSLTTAALVASLATASQAAIVAAVGEPIGGTSTTRSDYFKWVGYAFNTPDDTEVKVNRLGFWDQGGDGLIDSYQVAIFEFNSFATNPINPNGNMNVTMIATATIESGTSSTLEGGYRWVEIPELTLFKTAAQNAASSTRSYVIMFDNLSSTAPNDLWTNELGNAAPMNAAFGTLDTRAALAFSGASTVGSTGVSSQAGTSAFGGANFGFAIPEPTSALLCGMGALLLLRRQRM